MVNAFVSGLTIACEILAFMAGVLLALLLIAAAAALLSILTGVVFDRATSWLAKRWQAKGVNPKTRIGRTVLAHAKRDVSV